MSQPIRSKLRREVEDILRATGLPWAIEPGQRHDSIILNGHRVGVMSHGRPLGADSKKIASAIRQFIKRSEHYA